MMFENGHEFYFEIRKQHEKQVEEGVRLKKEGVEVELLINEANISKFGCQKLLFLALF